MCKENMYECNLFWLNGVFGIRSIKEHYFSKKYYLTGNPKP